MAVVLTGGDVSCGDAVVAQAPEGPHERLTNQKPLYRQAGVPLRDPL